MNKVYVLALLACLSGGLVEAKGSSDCFRESSDFCIFCCPEKKVTVCNENLCKPTPITEPITINEGGCYCLANDIDGQIIINADHVKISLNNKLINGNGGDAAIESTGPFKDITIIDGAIKNPGKTGIQLSNCNNVTLRNLVIHPVNIAIDLKNCLHSTLSLIKANHNMNVTKAVIFLDGCDNSILEDIETSNCTKTRTAEMPDDEGIISVLRSNNVTLRRFKSNSCELIDRFDFYVVNFFESDNATVEDGEVNDLLYNQPESHTGIIAGFRSTSTGTSLIMRRCQVNGGQVKSDEDVRGFLIELKNVLLTDCQSTGFRVTFDQNESSRFIGFDLSSVEDAILERCRSSDHEGFNIRGFEIRGARDVNFFPLENNSITLKSCISQSLVGDSSDSDSSVCGFEIRLFSQVVLEACQSSGHEGFEVIGFDIEGAEDETGALENNSLTMKCCISQALVGNLENSRSDVCGFDINDFPQVLLEECQSSGHEAFSVEGFDIGGDSLTMKCCISQSLVGNLENSDSEVFGFEIGSSSQVLLEGCQSSGHEAFDVIGFDIRGTRDEGSSLTMKCCISQSLVGDSSDSDSSVFGFEIDDFSQLVLEKCQSSGHEAFDVIGFDIDDAGLANDSLTMKCCISQSLKGTTLISGSDACGFDIEGFPHVVLEECQSSGHEAFDVKGFDIEGDNLTMKCCISQALKGTKGITSEEESEVCGFEIDDFSQVLLEKCQSSGHEAFEVRGFDIEGDSESSLTMKCCISQSLMGDASMEDSDAIGFLITRFVQVVLEKCQSSAHEGCGVEGFRISGNLGTNEDPIINEVTMRECISQALEGTLDVLSSEALGFLFSNVNRILLEKCQSNGHTATQVRGFDFRGGVPNSDPPVINDLTAKWCISQSLTGRFTSSSGSAIGFDTVTGDTLIFDHILFEGCQSNSHRGFKAIGYDLQAKDTIIFKNSSSSSCEGNLENSAGRAVGFNSVHTGIDPNISFEGCQSHEHSGFRAFGFNVEYSEGNRGNALFKECLSNNLVGSPDKDPDGLAIGFNIDVVKTARLEWCQSRCNTAFDARGISITSVEKSFTCLKCVGSEHTTNDSGLAVGFFISTSVKGSIEQCKAKNNANHGYSFAGTIADVNLDDNLAQCNGVDGFRFNSAGIFTGIVSRRNTALSNSVIGFSVPGGAIFTGGDWIDNYARGNGTDYSVVTPIQFFSRTAAGLIAPVGGVAPFEPGITNIEGI